MHHRSRLLVVIGLALTMACAASAEVPRTIHYQGKLTERDGTPLVGTHTITVRLYDALSGGSELWSEEHAITLDRADNGIFSVVLGSQTPFPATISFNDPLWLTLEIDGTGEFAPRQPLASVSYALNADQLDALDSTKFLRTDVDTSASGKLTLTRSGAALLVKPSTDPSADTTLMDIQNAAGGSKFSVDLEGDAVVAGDLTVNGTLTGTVSSTIPFNQITSGSNSGATMTVAGGGALTFSGGGIVNANQFQGQTVISVAGGGTGLSAYAAGDILYASAANTLSALAKGADGQVLKLSGGLPAWAGDSDSGGDITAVTAGAGLSGGGASGDVTLSLSTPVSAQNGGTGVGSYAAGDLLYASAAAALSKLPVGSDGQVLKVSGGLPAWGTDANTGGTITGVTAGTGLTGGGTSGNVTVSLSTPVSVANGGTGAATAADARTNLGLGSIATQTASAVAVTGGTVEGVTIGGTAPAAGTFTALTANASVNFPSNSITDAMVSDTLTASMLKGAGSTTNAVDLATAEVAGTLPVANGGTGAATLASGGVLLGQGTSAIMTTGVLAKGSLIIGDGVTDPTVLPVGGDGSILVADSTQTSGVRWAAGCMPIGGVETSGRNATFQMPTFGLGGADNSHVSRFWPIPASGTIDHLAAYVDSAPTGGASWTMTLRKNDADTTLSCTISGSAKTCTAAGAVSVAAGDRLGVRSVEGGNASNTDGSGWSACFVPD